MNSIKENFSDFLIIGGGAIGLSIARALHKKNAGKIRILERRAIGREASFAAAGMLAPNIETEKQDDFFYFCSESNALYTDFAGELFDETGVDIELDKNGTLYIALNKTDSAELQRRFEWQKRAGLQVELLTAAETRKTEPFVSPDVRESLFFPQDRQIENRKLLEALQKYCELNQIGISENTEIKSLLVEKGKITGAETGYEKYYAQKVILTTGAWTSLVKAENFLMPNVVPVRGQMISFHTAKRLFEKVIYSPRGYLVPRRDGRILIGATVEDAGFDNEITQAGIDFLREMAFEIAPGLGNLEMSESWSGLRPFSEDGLPILGKFPGIENLYIATAHYRNGILLTPLTANILADKIAGNIDSNYLKIFGPARFQKAKAI